MLEEILRTDKVQQVFDKLLVGNASKDDAAAYDMGNGTALISTTDFFMPIVDDAYDFGRIAAANAISDVYAMGGRPIMAVAILGWPVEKLPVALAQQVLEGARAVCAEAGIPLAGGHSIDTTEPVFGLAVSGGCDIVTAMTDVTGFGLGGHLIEMAEGSGLSAELYYKQIPVIAGAKEYLAKRIVPDATYRNWNGYGSKIGFDAGVDVMEAFSLLPDPQTNGGLLIAVAADAQEQVAVLLESNGYAMYMQPIGRMIAKQDKVIIVRG